jgi:ABC-2 type transport system ATP-binding protein
MTYPIELDELTIELGDVRALDGVSLSIEGGSICGILGRNGAGKSTLMSVIAAYRAPSAGAVLVDGQDPYEHERLMSEICLIREGGIVDESCTADEIWEIAAMFRPRWDQAYADQLGDRFGVPFDRKLNRLSRGQRAAINVTLGLASRAPVTMYDEAHLGMDAPTRYAFYDELLKDYLETPRTILFSTHHVDEVASLLEDVVILDRGTVLLHERADDVRTKGTEITGPADQVDAFTAGLTRLHERSLGSTRSVAVLERFGPDRQRAATAAGLDLGPIDLQDLFVHLTNRKDDA